MRSIQRTVLLVLLGALALSAVAASAASAAQPEFTGSFPKTFEYTSNEGIFLQTAGKRALECAAVAPSKGEITAAKTASLTLVATACELVNGLKSVKPRTCRTPGAKAGEIKTNLLAGKLAYLEKKKHVGIVFGPKTGSVVAEAECGAGSEGETIKVKGSVILGAIKPVNVSTVAHGLSLKQSGGHQEPAEYENELGETVGANLEAEGAGVEPFAAEQAGLAGELGSPSAPTITTASATKVSAEVASAGLPEFTHYPVGFVGTTGKVTFTSAGSGWSYREGLFSGEITGPNEVAGIKLTLKSPQFEACTNGKEELVLNELSGRLGYLNKATKSVGLLLEPTLGSLIATCSGSLFGEQKYLKSVIGQITPVNKAQTTSTVSITAPGGKQSFTKFEGETATHELENQWGGTGHAKMSMDDSEMAFTFERELEVKG